MNNEPAHCEPRGLAPATPGDDELARALRQLALYDHTAFTERLLIDWACAVRQETGTTSGARDACQWPAGRGVRRRVTGRTRALALACALPLCVLLVQAAVGRMNEQMQMRELATPDALSELSFGLL